MKFRNGEGKSLLRVVVGSCICIAGSIFLCPLIVIGSLNQQLPHYYDRTNNIIGVGTLAQGSTDPDGYGRERMHDEAVLDKMKYLVFIFLGSMVLYLLYVNYMIRTHPFYFFGI